jgi:hypothetical protein
MPTVLLTSHSLDERYGTELYVASVAAALRERGWTVGAFSLVLGDVAELMRSRGIAVSDRLEDLPAPDLIHGNCYFETLLAHLAHPGAPIFSLLHVENWWLQYPPFVPALRRVGAVGDDCREAAVGQLGFAAAEVEWHPNFADPERFKPRGPLPEKPRRALVFSNYASDDTFLPAVGVACQEMKIVHEVRGARSGQVTSEPEHLLGQYDLVFAKGRAAIEAMVTGCAVVLCDYAGVGPMVTVENLESLRRLNFGLRTLTRKLTAQQLVREIVHFDPVDAAAVTDAMRRQAALGAAIDRLEATYRDLLDSFPGSPPLDRPPWSEQLRELVASGSECNRTPVFAGAMAALVQRLAPAF